MKTLTFAAVLILAAVCARAEVVKVDVTARQDVPKYGYERITGRVHFAVDPKNPRNAIIVDLDKAPRQADGRVVFTSDVLILKPKSGGNGVAVVDVVNRGNPTAFRLNRPETGDVYGDGFLMRRGFTIICIGWEFDVPVREGAIRADMPVATDITGVVRAAFTLDRPDTTYTVGDVAPYKPVDPDGADSVLTVHDGQSATFQTVPRNQWKIAGNVVTMTGGFEPGRNYVLAFKAANPPIGGLGFAAVRDVAAWAKHTSGALAPATYTIGFGVSQTGRFLRDFLYEGFNTDEQDRQALDGMVAHIAGSARLDLNRRWATPTGLGMYSATAFPFADAAQKDPISGVTDGLLDNPRARQHQPKIFYTNSAVEYWGGGRVAALFHLTADGSRDVMLPANVRTYFITGSQHGPSAFPPPPGAGQQKPNPTDHNYPLRALFVAMDKWVREGTVPPPSQYPQLDKGTLVKVSAVAFPAIPGVQSPRTLTGGFRAPNTLVTGGAGGGSALPLVVPQVDKDGNETAGIRLPEVAVPLATYTGWNFRNTTVGGTAQLVSLMGSYIPLARTKAERDARHDPRPSIAERYASRDAYMDRIQKTADALVTGGYLLAEDVPGVVKRAAEHWEFATHDVKP